MFSLRWIRRLWRPETPRYLIRNAEWVAEARETPPVGFGLSEPDRDESQAGADQNGDRREEAWNSRFSVR
jgi:hypothetical protein